MRSWARFESVPSLVFAVSIGVLLVPLSFLPAGANPLPESAILIHVQPVSDAGCTTEITHCNQIVRTTTAQGPLEFLVFYYPAAYQEQHYGILDLTTSLTLPEAWELLSWEPCGGGLGDLEFDGSGYPVHLWWPECPPIAEQVMLVARLLIDVEGPGKLDFYHPYADEVQLRCEDPFTTYPIGVDAEAGMDCDFTAYTCASWEQCTPSFVETQLHLVAHAGESASGELAFGASVEWCTFTAGSEAAWAEGSVVWDPRTWEYRLMVTADAGELEAGMYQTRVQVKDTYDRAARCVEVLFEVLEGASVPDLDAPAIESCNWGRIKSGYR